MAETIDVTQAMRKHEFQLRKLSRLGDPQALRLFEASRATLARRIAEPWKINYPAELPITDRVEDIARALHDHQVVVVAGETGSGKTTQIPKICLQTGFGRRGMIGHTQPRRIAARTISQRIADELQVELGRQVGYAVRFTDKVTDETAIKVMTDGLLLTEIRRDRYLENYDVIIIDEAHERSLNIDFLLGYLKTLLGKRRDLKLIITSATIDVQSFSQHFFDAPVIEVSGRSYPVETVYVDVETDLEDSLPGVIAEIQRHKAGRSRDILMFQTGEREIFETAKLLRATVADAFDILPLYARLSTRDQQRVFKSGDRRRIVLATNVAETSLTVPNIGFVIDPGLARINRYSYRSKLQRLPVEPISQASAQQRQGRCGRIAPGVCFRLYGEDDFNGRAAFTDPEIKRVNLASVVLQMRAFGLGSIDRFPFLDPPDPRAIKDAMLLLHELGALAGDKLTKTGRLMARLPVDPRLGRMLVAADRLRSLHEVCVIVAGLAVQDPRERPLAAQQQADTAHAKFADERSDFMSFVTLWHWVEERRRETTRSAFQKALRQRFLNVQRVREWRELHRQLVVTLRELGLRLNATPADFASVHRAILCGALSLIGQHDEKGNYLGARGLKLRIFPGSALSRKTPKWLAAAEITETRRIYARNVAAVEAKWIEEAAQHLVKRQQVEPHWSLKQGEVMAYESVLLYGLKLADRRLVRYADLDPALARQIFIRDGIVRGAINKHFVFLERNQALIAELQELEAKGRRRDLLAHEDMQIAFYAERLPEQVVSVASLDAWLRNSDAGIHERLCFTRDQLLNHIEVAYTEVDFPATLNCGGEDLAINYRFAPGAADDGVNLTVPVGLLQTVVAEDLEWLVPGLLPNLIEGWLRSLPKQARKQLAPISGKVEALTGLLVRPDRYRRGRFLTDLTETLRDLSGVAVDALDWDRTRLDLHLLINVRVVDEERRVVAQGRDVAPLQAQFMEDTRARVAEGAGGEFERDQLVTFPESEVPMEIVLQDKGGSLVGYPALVDAGETVALKIAPSKRERDALNRDGYARLAWLSLGSVYGYFKRELAAQSELGLRYVTLGDAATLSDTVLRGVAWYCFFEDKALPMTRAAFEQRLIDGRPQLAEVFNATVEILGTILKTRFDLMRRLDELDSPAFAFAVQDVREQVATLVPADVLRRTPRRYLTELPRYLDAAQHRLSQLQGKVRRDRDLAEATRALYRRLEALWATGLVDESAWLEARFGLEELRVSQFAERMGTRGRISLKKMAQNLLDLERQVGLR